MPTIRIGTPTMHGSAAIGLTQTAAPTTSSAVTQAIDVSGIANRIVRASASTSAVVRETRSPMPARSTVESGSARTRRMKSSRSSANICSERTNEARRAKNVRIVWATRKTARIDHDAVDLRRVDLRLQALDERAEERRPDEAGGGGEGVQDERRRPSRADGAARGSPPAGACPRGSRSAGACSCRLSPGDDVAVRRARAEQLAVRPARLRRARRR